MVYSYGVNENAEQLQAEVQRYFFWIFEYVAKKYDPNITLDEHDIDLERIAFYADKLYENGAIHYAMRDEIQEVLVSYGTFLRGEADLPSLRLSLYRLARSILGDAF